MLHALAGLKSGVLFSDLCQAAFHNFQFIPIETKPFLPDSMVCADPGDGSVTHIGLFYQNYLPNFLFLLTPVSDGYDRIQRRLGLITANTFIYIAPNTIFDHIKKAPVKALICTFKGSVISRFTPFSLPLPRHL